MRRLRFWGWPTDPATTPPPLVQGIPKTAQDAPGDAQPRPGQARTPGPYHVGTGGKHAPATVYGAGGRVVARCHEGAWRAPTEEERANAAYLVRAVEAYAPLRVGLALAVEELERIRDWDTQVDVKLLRELTVILRQNRD